jgi:hypothetical protein
MWPIASRCITCWTGKSGESGVINPPRTEGREIALSIELLIESALSSRQEVNHSVICSGMKMLFDKFVEATRLVFGHLFLDWLKWSHGHDTNSFLASGLTAVSTGRQVMIYYDDSTSNCYGAIISNGGIAAQCR